MFEELAVLEETFDGVGMIGARTVHEFVEVVRQPLLGLLARAIGHGDHRGVVRSFLFFLPLCVEGPLSSSARLALTLPRPPLKIALIASSLEAWLVAMSSRSRLV